jgi:hypothetical protein
MPCYPWEASWVVRNGLSYYMLLFNPKLSHNFMSKSNAHSLCFHWRRDPQDYRRTQGRWTERKGLDEELGFQTKDGSSRQGSVTALVTPSGSYVHDSSRKG